MAVTARRATKSATETQLGCSLPIQKPAGIFSMVHRLSPATLSAPAADPLLEVPSLHVLQAPAPAAPGWL